MNIAKRHEYEDFAQGENLPIFHQPWWLDTICKDGNWDVCLAKNGDGKLLGALPYCLTSRAGLKLIRTPSFTPYLGVWLDYSTCSDRNVNRYGFENEVIGNLVEQLPKVAWYHQIHPPTLQNWLPFYWQGYQQTTRYTYVLEDLDETVVLKNMKDKTRNLLLKAQKAGVTIKEKNDFDDFLQVYGKTFERQKLPFKLDVNMLRLLHSKIQQQGQGAIYFAEDASGATHAALYMLWDTGTAYCWQLGADTELRKSGAVQLLLWHSIQEASKKVKSYNFEGSMLPHIEPVFRAFGAVRKPVFQIRKFGNRFLEALWVLLKG